MKKMIVAAAFLSFVFAAGVADAQAKQHRTPAMRQNESIRQGVRHGQLTRQEARELRGRQAKVRHMQRVARHDGRVTPYERHRIQRANRHLDYAIYHKKHNVYRRY